MKIEFGKLVGGMTFLPTIGITWVDWRGKRYYDLRMQWLMWYAQTDNWRVVLSAHDKEWDW